MTTTEQRSAHRSASDAPAAPVAPSHRVAVAAARVLVATDRKLGRDTPADVRRLAAGSTRRTA